MQKHHETRSKNMKLHVAGHADDMTPSGETPTSINGGVNITPPI